jgi:hypothetical protein
MARLDEADAQAERDKARPHPLEVRRWARNALTRLIWRRSGIWARIARAFSIVGFRGLMVRYPRGQWPPREDGGRR